jgi:YegS/Rv2252/BmrU family lipid kinase
MASPRRALAVVNPSTGNVSLWKLKRLLGQLAEREGVDLQLHVTEYPGHGTELVKEHGAEMDLLLAVGGDGTLSEVVTGAAGFSTQIGIIPTGSTNVVAKDLGIPLRISQAASVAFQSPLTIEIDVARAGDTTFMHMAGAGFDARIMKDTPRRWKKTFGWLAYLVSGVSELRAKPFPLTLTIDGTVSNWQARTVLCALGGSIAHPRFPIGQNIDRADGVLDILVLDPPNTGGWLSTLGWVLAGRPAKSRWQHHLRGRVVKLESPEPVPFETDGTYWGDLPVTVEILDTTATIIVPAVPTPGEIRAHLRN